MLSYIIYLVKAMTCCEVPENCTNKIIVKSIGGNKEL